MEKRPLGHTRQKDDPAKVLEKEIAALHIDDPEPEEVAHRPRSKRRAGVVLVALLVLAIGAFGAYGALWWYREYRSSGIASSENTNSSEPAPDPMVTELLYAYKENTSTVVRRVIMARPDERQDVVEFEETIAYEESDNYFDALPPAVDYNEAAKSLLYVEKNQITSYNLQTNVKDVLIREVGESSRGGVIGLEPTPPIDNSIFSVVNPRWSRDGLGFAFEMGAFEGSNYAYFDLQRNDYANLGDTYRYASEEAFGGTFETVPEAAELARAAVGETYVISPEVPFRAIEYDAADVPTLLYGVLCPLDLPETGDSLYLAGAETEGQRDCGERSNTELVRIDLQSGDSDVLASGNYADIAVAGEQIYVLDYDAVMYQIDDNKPKRYDIKLADLAKTGTASLERIDIMARDGRLFALVYAPGENGRKVSVIDVLDKKMIANFDLAAESSFRLLDATIE